MFEFLPVFFNGIFVGIFIVIAIECLLIYNFIFSPILYNQPSEVSPIKERKETEDDFQLEYEKWPQHLREYLMNALDPKSNQILTPEIMCNVLLSRFFIQCRTSKILEIKLKEKLITRLRQKLKPDSSGSLVQGVDVTHIYLGQHPPSIEKVELLKNTNRNYNLDLTFEFLLNYVGGCQVTIVTSLNMGLKIPVSVQLNCFRGKFQLRIPSPFNSDHYAVAFLEDPGVSFTIESSLLRRDNNEMLKDVLNSFLAKKLKNLFLESFVLPNWKDFEMPLINYRPLRIPEIEAFLDQQQQQHGEGKSLTLQQKEENSSTLSLSRRRSTILPIPDGLHQRCFPITALINKKNLNEYQKMLLNQFTRLVFETGKIQSPKEDGKSLLFESVSEDDFSIDFWLSSNWEVVRNRRDILLEKKSIFIKGLRSEIYRSSFKAKCSPEKAFQILQNPEHLRHIEDFYTENFVLKRFDNERCIRRMNYKIGRQEFFTIVFEICSRLSENFIICSRSCQYPSTDNLMVRNDFRSQPLSPVSHSPKSKPSSSIQLESVSADFSDTGKSPSVCYLNGYYIQSIPNQPDQCQIFTLSQFGSNSILRLNVNWQRSHKLKLFLEELTEWTALVAVKERRESAETGKKNLLELLNNQLDYEDAFKRRPSDSSEKWKTLLNSTLSLKKFLNKYRNEEQVQSSSSNNSQLRHRSLSDGHLAD